MAPWGARDHRLEIVSDGMSTFGPERGALIGAACLGVLGALAGLILGLLVHPSTAWFALFEVGLPATIIGALVGAIVGLAARAFRQRKNRRADIKHRLA